LSHEALIGDAWTCERGLLSSRLRKLSELGGTMTGVAFADDPACSDVDGGEQKDHAVALVVMAPLGDRIGSLLRGRLRAGGVTRLRQMDIRAKVELLKAAFHPPLHNIKVRRVRAYVPLERVGAKGDADQETGPSVNARGSRRC